MFDKTLTYDQVAGLLQRRLAGDSVAHPHARDPGLRRVEGHVPTGGRRPAPITYQWRKDGAPLAGKTEATLSSTTCS